MVSKDVQNSTKTLFTFVFAHGPLALAAAGVPVPGVLVAEPGVERFLHGGQEIGDAHGGLVAHVAAHAVRLTPALVRLLAHEVSLVIWELPVPCSICGIQKPS